MDTVITHSRWILEFFIFTLNICVVWLVQLRIVEGPSLAARGQRVRTPSTEVATARGTITDATEVVLADSIQTYDVAADQLNIHAYVHRDDDGNEVKHGSAEATHQLTPLLGMGETELDGMMLGDSTYRCIKRNVDTVTHREIRKLNIYGIGWESVFEREYPNGSVATPVIDTVNADRQGPSGVEARFNAFLTDTPDAQTFKIAPNGAVMPGDKKTVVESKDGGDIELVMCTDLQYQVQDPLDAHVVKHHVDWGTVVIEDVVTEHVLVMADSNSTEPDSAKPQKVYMVQDTLEPGSIGKLMTVGVTLNRGTISPTSVFQVPYVLDLLDVGRPIMDLHEHDDETLMVTGVLAESSNTGTIFIGQTMSDDRRYSMMHALGFDQGTDVGLSDGSASLLRDADRWQRRDRYVAMFDQAYMIVAMQGISALATVANGKVRISSCIVKSWANTNGTVEVLDVSQPVQVTDAQAASQPLTMMEPVAENERDTAGAAKVPDYRAGVKIGTAETVINSATGLVSITAGIIPVDASHLAITMVLYNPKVAPVSSDSSALLLSDTTRTAAASLSAPTSMGLADLYPTTLQI